MPSPGRSAATRRKTWRRRVECAAAAVPLRTSFLLVLAFVVAGMAAVLLPSALHDATRDADEHALAILTKRVRLVRERLEDAPVELAAGALRREFGALHEDDSFRTTFLVSGTGKVLHAMRADLVGLDAGEALRRAGEPPALAREAIEARKPGGSTARIEGARAIVLCPMHIEGRPVLLVVRDILAARAHARRRVWREAAAFAIALLAVAAALWTWLEVALTRRARRLVETAERFAADHPEARARLTGNDELSAVGRAFDAMADSVAEARALSGESEARVRLLLESSAEGICGLDEDGRITFCNSAATRLLGAERPGDLVGRAFYQLLRTPGNEPLADHFVAKAIGSQASFDEELAIPRPDGSLVPVRYLGAPILAKEKLIGRVVSLSDLSEKKRAEEQLLESQAQLRMADRLATVGTLSAGVAHEINNPLAYTIANLGYVADCLKNAVDREVSLDPRQLREAVEEALQGAERVSRIVKDMKTLSRVDDERIAAVDVERALDASINMALHELRHKATVVKDYGGVGTARANEGRLVQVFLNMLVNSAQAIPEMNPGENEVRIATRIDREGRIAVEISDTGSGIPDEILPRIFDPFFTTKPLGVGTGLGLPICHSLIHAIGGRIEVTSKVGVGTRFLITLPRLTGSAHAEAETASVLQ